MDDGWQMMDDRRLITEDGRIGIRKAGRAKKINKVQTLLTT